jgi:hypothetical protein
MEGKSMLSPQKDNLKAAQDALANAQANQHISSIARVATDLATAHALVSIAESLRTILQPTPPRPQRTFGGKPVRTVPLTPLSVLKQDGE